MPRRSMHLLAYLKTGPTATFAGGWRHPEATLHDIFAPERYEHIARELEAACFDGCFFADGLGISDTYGGSFHTYVGRGAQISYLDPMMVLPLMARVTRNLGIATTISTTFNQPYQVARQLASLDHLSGGRIAWNVVTSATNTEARNFGLDEIPPRDDRYDIADDFLAACNALWNTWDADALVQDKQSGVYADPAKVHYADYVGPHFKTRGPLSVPRSPQGRPVVMQAGASPRGRSFAARWAEIIFASTNDKADLMAFTTDMRRRLAEQGRDPEACVIMPEVRVVVGETEAIAAERAAYMQSMLDPEVSLATASTYFGADLSKTGVGAVAGVQGNQGIQGIQDRVQTLMQTENISLQDAAKRPRKDFVGTPAAIADRMQDLFESGACDGFVVSPIYFPGMLEEFGRAVVPELQRRGLFRTRYAGRTLRENLRA